MTDAGGELAGLVRATDWAATPLGPQERWPQSLRTTLGICLESPVPILVWWGPELVVLYNDAYRPLLGARHPAALGRPGETVFGDEWESLGPLLDGVLEGGEAAATEDELLVVERTGYREECYFRFSYGPVRDEAGAVAGVLGAATETTGRVLGARRLRSLRDLAAAAAAAPGEAEACAAATRVLAGGGDVPFSLVYRLEPDGSTARLAGAAGVRAGIAPRRVDLRQAATDPAAKILSLARSTREPLLVGEPDAFAGDAPGAARAAALPLEQVGESAVTGFLVAALDDLRPLDDPFEDYLRLAAGEIAAALSDARARSQGGR